MTVTSKALVAALDRRSLLAGSGALALSGLVPRGVHAQAAGPEVTKAILGYIALTDAAPLIIAKEKGLFEKYGMKDVEVAKQASWAPRATISCWAARLTASTARTS